MAKKKTAKQSPENKKLKPNRSSGKVGPVTEVTTSRDIADRTRWMLWGKAAGRCEFSGCNNLLWLNQVTQEQVNIAEAAHIYAFSSKGPRGNRGIRKDKLNKLDNLMLACHACHKTMDQDKTGTKYSVELLQQWKNAHEKRVETVTAIDPKKSSHIVFFEAPIGNQTAPLEFDKAAHALFPDYYPAEPRVFELGSSNSTFQDKSPEYWQVMRQTLDINFDRKVLQLREAGEIKHLSIFGLAPQPLLIYLGSLMVDISAAQVYQLYREPNSGWNWPETEQTLDLQIRKPDHTNGPPALVIGLTADVANERISSVLPDACIWMVTMPEPRHDHIKSQKDLSYFRQEVRKLLDEIKLRHGQQEPLHIFPVAGNSVSIELGRIRQPKAMMPWLLYDQIQGRGFVHVMDIN